jgi:hypothetical protein
MKTHSKQGVAFNPRTSWTIEIILRLVCRVPRLIYLGISPSIGYLYLKQKGFPEANYWSTLHAVGYGNSVFFAPHRCPTELGDPEENGACNCWSTKQTCLKLVRVSEHAPDKSATFRGQAISQCTCLLSPERASAFPKSMEHTSIRARLEKGLPHCRPDHLNH